MNRNFEDSREEPALPEAVAESSARENVLGGGPQTLDLLEFDQILFRLAEFTRTVIGREAALALTPSRDLLEIASRQQETTEARQFLDRGGSLELGPGIDLRECVHRGLLGGLLRGEELCSVQDLVGAARSARAGLSRHEELPLLSSVAENLPDLRALGQAILSAISPAGEVLDDASPALSQMRMESRAAYHRLNQVMDRSLRRFHRQDLVQEQVVTERNGRLVLLIKAEMRSRVPGIVHDVSDTGATVFIEPMPAIELGNRWRESRRAAEREEERILRYLSGRVGEDGEDLLLTLDLMARLDLDMAKGRYSTALRAIPPWVSHQSAQERNLRLTGARHPLLTGEVVPVSLELGGRHGVMLITGPNAGGKTVTLKMIGLLALMAHAGLHVPADEARFPRLDGIYADIGDQQSIQQSLSTFSSHIKNLLSIIRQVTGQSLVLVDELGTSTDPEEGSALAKAILNHFQRLGPLVVATTHHRGVAHHVQEQQGMINASVDLHPETLEPTYRVTLGVPGRSYALTIAANLGTPPEVLREAEASLSPVEQATENLLRELQEERRVVEDLRQQAESALSRARDQEQETETRLAQVETEKGDLLEETRRELQERVAGLLEQLRQAEAALEAPDTRRVVQEQRSQLNRVRRQLASPQWQPIEVKRDPWLEELNPGDRVYIRGIPRSVEVVTPPDEEGQLEVLLGTMRATIPVYQLQKPAEGGDQGQQALGPGISVRRSSQRTAAGEIDLRGQRVDEALDKVEGILNDASLAGGNEIRIIHGRGTGALRHAIREYLDGHPLVESLAAGEGGGGEGVTVVALR
ncbi:MAG: hypothetical protein BZY88_18015 [SAR202 cluster bacterium Io17-Chloro-G9]|nr:MAG: hypothetical protein BZY88_18015 [SAR202 cluster bacterium Io17-Chloro-G9]